MGIGEITEFVSYFHWLHPSSGILPVALFSRLSSSGCVFPLAAVVSSSTSPPEDRQAEAGAERGSVRGGLSEPAAQPAGSCHLLQVRSHGLEVEGPQTEGAVPDNAPQRTRLGQIHGGSRLIIWEEVSVWIYPKYLVLELN